MPTFFTLLYVTPRVSGLRDVARRNSNLWFGSTSSEGERIDSYLGHNLKVTSERGQRFTSRGRAHFSLTGAAPHESSVIVLDLSVHTNDTHIVVTHTNTQTVAKGRHPARAWGFRRLTSICSWAEEVTSHRGMIQDFLVERHSTRQTLF